MLAVSAMSAFTESAKEVHLPQKLDMVTKFSKVVEVTEDSYKSSFCYYSYKFSRRQMTPEVIVSPNDLPSINLVPARVNRFLFLSRTQLRRSRGVKFPAAAVLPTHFCHLRRRRRRRQRRRRAQTLSTTLIVFSNKRL